MKKQKLKLGLQKMNISNLQNLHTLKGGQGSVLLCSDTDCGETPNCATQGGFMCGETMATDCGIDNTLNPPCISDITCTTFYVDTCANTYPHTNGCFPVTE